jgi:NAD(P)H dehydrogenase (quinone)
MRRAFEGVDTLLLVSAAEAEDRRALHRNAIDAAADAGVGRVVYTSFLGASADATFTFARDHFHAEEDIRARGLGHTFVRSSLYVDFLPELCGPDGVIRGPADGGLVAPVARDDVADVIAVVLTGHGHDGQTYDVTGAELITMDGVAAELSRATRRQIRFERETLDEARASRQDSEAPDWMIEGWVTTYAAIAAGELELVTEVVEELTGHTPVRLGDWLRENPESMRHLQHTS